MAVVRPAPDLSGFREAQDTKRLLLGSDVTFRMAPVYTWPPDTPINPDTGQPFDPTIEPASVEQPTVVVRCGVFFKAVNRGGAANAAIATPAGVGERSRIFAIAPWSARAALDGAIDFIWHEAVWKIGVVKVDEIIAGYRRILIYAAAE